MPFIAALVGLAMAGCGESNEGSDDATPAGPASADAAQLFNDNCGNCHTLATAGATGKVGPDLDQLRPGPDLVRVQVENGGGSMPAFKGRLSPEQIQAIADYVAENAGKS